MVINVKIMLLPEWIVKLKLAKLKLLNQKKSVEQLFILNIIISAEVSGDILVLALPLQILNTIT